MTLVLPAPRHPVAAGCGRGGAGDGARPGHRTDRLPALGRRRLGRRERRALGHGLSPRGRGMAVSARRPGPPDPGLRIAGLLRHLRDPLALAAHAPARRDDVLLVSRPRVAGRASWSSSCASIRSWRRASRPRSSRAWPSSASASRGWRRSDDGEPSRPEDRPDRDGARSGRGLRPVARSAAVPRRWRRTSRCPTWRARRCACPRLRGQVVLLNLWTTWCPPCREEMPSMERLYQRLRDRGFVLLAVSQDEGGKAAVVEPFVRDLGLTFPVLVDPEHQVGRPLRGLGVSGVLHHRPRGPHRRAGHRPARLGSAGQVAARRAPARCTAGQSAGAGRGPREEQISLARSGHV